MRLSLWLLALITCATLSTVGLAFQDEPEPIEPDKPIVPARFKRLTYRNIGPSAGGRVSRVAGVPGNPLLYYAATASGGVWKSTNGGTAWKPIFDDNSTLSCGSIAVANTNANIIYVGTGEANIRGNVQPGNGIYKSSDGGKNWQHVWKQRGQIGTMIVHPSNADVAFAAVLGRAFSPNADRGVYRTKDGGKNWEKVLFVDEETGAADVCFDPSSPSTLYAGMWQTRRRPWELTSGGPGSGLYVSRDGGDSWKKLTGKGLPEGIWGKVGVAVAPSDSDRVYALIEAEEGGLFRSDDGGETWKIVNKERVLRQRAWYYNTITVDPTNADILYCPQVPLVKSVDGGKTFTSMTGLHHGDHHDLWIDPTNPKRMINGNDGGVDITSDGGKTWFAPPLPISQFYRINVDNRNPYHVFGTMQDLGSAGGPSNSLRGTGIHLGDWQSVGGGETGYVLPMKKDDFIFAGEYAGIITRFNRKTGQAKNVSIYPDNPSGHGGVDMKYRFRWPAPIAGSPHDPKVLYHAGNVLFRSNDLGQTWKALSEDLTRNDKSKQQWSGGPITGDNTTAEFYCTISAVAESPRKKGVIWVGSDDGLLHLSQDDGKTWKNLSEKLPRFPDWATIKMIEPSPHEAGTALIVVDAHLLDDMKPYLFRTKDFGGTWESLSEKMPQENYLHVCRIDPVKKNLMFAGADNGVLFSSDEGITWEPLKLNLPPVAVTDLLVQGNDLVVGTHGRSLWILDDINLLRQKQPEAEESIFLYTPSEVTRWQIAGGFTSYNLAGFENPPTGAVLQYVLSEKVTGTVKLEIFDAKDNKVIDFTGKVKEKPKKDADDKDKKKEEDEEEKKGKKPKLPVKPGLHRFLWNLAGEGGKAIEGAQVDAGDPELGPTVNPGKYTVKLTANDKTVTSNLVIKPDPRVKYAAGELEEQEAFAIELRGQLNALTETVEGIRSLQKQLKGRDELLKKEKDPRYKELKEESKKFAEKLTELEERMHNPKAKVPYDILAMKGGAKLYSRLCGLYAWVADGDGKPNQGQKEVAEVLKKEQAACVEIWKELSQTALPKLNEAAKKLEVPILFLGGKKAT